MRIRIPSLRSLALSAILGTFFLFACQLGGEEKVEATISFNQIFDSLVQYDRVVISLKDKQGTTIDVVFDGQVKIPGDLEKRPAPHWDGGAITVSIVGYKGDAIVYRSETGFTGTSNKKDSVYVFVSPDIGIATLLRSIPMREGDSIDFPAITITPANLKIKDLVWSSLAPEVVRVGATGFKALRAGNSQITVSLSIDATKALAILVTVIEPAKIPDSLYLSAKVLKLIAGGAPGRLDVNFVPSTAVKDVIWSIHDTTIATVSSDGLVQGKKGGETRLLVASSLKAAANDSALIVVTSPKPPERVVFAKSETEIFLGGVAESLLVTILPPEAIQNFDFTVTTPLLIELKNGRISGLGEGYGEVIAKSRENLLLSDTLKVRVSRKQVINSVTVSKKTLLVFTGGDEPILTAAIDPSTSPQKVQWRADQPGIAKVSDAGKVTGLVAGHTRIHAISLADSTQQDSADITVKTDAPVVSIGRPDTTVSVGSTITFLPVVSPQEFGLVAAFRWDVDGIAGWDDTANAVQGVTVKFEQEKEYTLRFYVRDSEGNETIAIKKVSAVIGLVVTIVAPADGAYFTKPALKIEWKIDNVTQTTGTDTLLKYGANTITRSAKDAAGKVYSTFVTVYLDTVPPVKPAVKGPGGNVNGKPAWTWSPGGGGNGTFRIAVDSQVFTRLEFKDTLFIPDPALAEGLHTLYVQERDAAGNWSGSGVFVTRVDRTGPINPVVKINVPSPSKEKKPVWSWTTGGGGGSGLFQFKFNNADFATGASSPAPDTQFIPATDLGNATHTLYVRERDSLGNWSEIGSATIVIDTTPPGAPKVLANSPTNINTPTWTWTETGTGTADFEYKLDNNDFSSGATATRALIYKPTTALLDGIHTLYVREKDAQGAWGLAGSAAVEVDTKPAVITITSPLPDAKITSSPVTVTWRVDGGNLQTNTETLSGLDGERTITRTGTDLAANPGSGSVKVILDLAKPAMPVFLTPATATSNTRSRRPAWTWRSGGGDVGGGFRYQLGTATPVLLPGMAFTPTTDQPDGTYVLKVAEKDAQDNWSTDAISTVTIKGSAPAAPTVTVDAAFSDAPRWSWTGTPGATFGYKLSGAASFISEGTATTYQPTAVQMGEGLKTICVAEKDVIGYGPEACQSITVDRTKPVIAITSDVSAELMVTSVNPTFSGTVSDANLDKVQCKVGTVDSVNAIISAGNWSCTPSISDGDFSVTFTAFDKAQNSASTTAVTVHKRSKVVFVRKNRTGDGTSWAKANGDIGDVLKEGVTLAPGTEVWVSAGTYLPTTIAGAYKFTSNTSIIGGFSNAGAPFNRTEANQNNLVNIDPANMDIGTQEEPVNNLTLFGIVFNAQISDGTEGSTPKMYINFSTGFVIERCTFINFRRDIPLLIRLGSNVTIKSSVFKDNSTGTYGAIAVWGGFAEFIDCTITGNLSNDPSFAGGLTIFSESSVKLTNCRLSGNKKMTRDENGELTLQTPMNMYVMSGGRLDHSGLVLPEGGSTVTGEGIVSPEIR